MWSTDTGAAKIEVLYFLSLSELLEQFVCIYGCDFLATLSVMCVLLIKLFVLEMCCTGEDR